MQIFYQGKPGSYSHKVGIDIAEFYGIKSEDIVGIFSFRDMFEKFTTKNGIGIVPIENSYAGSIHENFYNINNNSVNIIGEYFLPVRHYLLSSGKNKKILNKCILIIKLLCSMKITSKKIILNLLHIKI